MKAFETIIANIIAARQSYSVWYNAFLVTVSNETTGEHHVVFQSYISDKARCAAEYAKFAARLDEIQGDVQGFIAQQITAQIQEVYGDEEPDEYDLINTEAQLRATAGYYDGF